jgi:FkbM family methyltransferase
MSLNIPALLRALPAFKGKTRLGRLLVSDRIKNSRDIQIKGKYGCEYTLPNLNENLSFDILLNGIYEPATHDFLMRSIPAGSMVLDIGANIGSVCIPLAKRRSDIRFICLEASPFVFNYLTKNVQQNGLAAQITCINKAVTAEDGQTLPFYSAPEHFGKGSLSPVYTTEPVMVEGTTIDTLLQSLQIQQVGFIKADIEGFECMAFKGSQGLLSKPDAPAMLFEFVDWAEENAGLQPGTAQELVAGYGYELFILHSNNSLQKLTTGMKQGSAMIYAQKTSQHG